jgi:hypothetical protein
MRRHRAPPNTRFMLAVKSSLQIPADAGPKRAIKTAASAST